MIALFCAFALASDPLETEAVPEAEPWGVAACDSHESLLDLVSRLDRAEAAYLDLDIDGFSNESSGLIEAVGCLGETLSPSIVAKIHRIQGISAFAANQHELSASAFAAARAIEPDHRFGGIPDGHPMMKRYLLLDPLAIETTQVPAAKSGRLQFDGVESRFRPDSRPVAVQYLDQDGHVRSAGYLLPGDPIIRYPEKEPPPPKRLPMAMIASTAGSAVLTGAIAGAYAASRSSYEGLDEHTADGQARLDPARNQANALAISTWAAAGVTVGLGGVTTYVSVR